MEINYKTKKVEKICTNHKEAKKKLGHEVSLNLSALLQKLTAAKNLNDLRAFKKHRVHTLKGDRKGQVSLTIHRSSPLRVVCRPKDEEGNYWNGKDELNMYTSYEIIEIEEISDYHE